ncbi:UDP-N-acetylmuramoyl-L-alanyl-D-glutamate--2,6-diaminopimelate ligase [bacterium]|nr:UDP-N-acetylmuramoyl-L-alanyl-D-glutamate--2,6-diaminopimelate ligase [bacterium]
MVVGILSNHMYHFDSRKIRPGDTFICLPGGEAHIEDAKSRGAVEVLRMTRSELAEFANRIYQTPSKQLKVIGVTGTNGKTTVTHLIAHGLKAAGYKPALLGTLNAALTTPESLDIAQAMRAHADAGGTHFVMEVSSHAIHQGRISGIDFDVRVLTNITQDHLDYHKTFEAYKAVKMSFMAGPGASIYPERFETEALGFSVPLPGRFNYKNFQAAVAVLRHYKIPEPVINASMASATAPPGRFERVSEGQDFDVIVDYAHTPDGLENVLKEARIMADMTQGRVITVFGCGGDRDRTKRPKMGRIAEQIADVVVVTSDNPRTEDPDAIIDEIKTGLERPDAVVVFVDRRDAIRYAISVAQKGDVVVLAGKGHETYQILGKESVHFDDREVARESIQARL